MDYHHETQPMPNPVSRWFHHLPQPFHRMEGAGNLFAQLVLPFGLLLPQPIASICALLLIATQLYLVVSGNYAWLNWLTIFALVAGVSDTVLGDPLGEATAAPAPAWFTGLLLALALMVVVLSYRPVRNLLSPSQAMNASFEPFHLVNTYGAFGSVTRTRIEVVVEGTSDPRVGLGTEWQEYEFKGKPGAEGRTPPQVAPYHLRLDWLMWFIPLSPRYAEGWFLTFLVRLLEADPQTLALLAHDPFDGRPPAYVRARLFHYRYSTWEERKVGGLIWVRTFVGEYVRPISLAAEEPRARTPFGPGPSA